ncbi:hypothetical protein Btru_039728 [Bulinus truncatus]|nr:hypothetical protein Btru_039728 [Bulinus truncatus]
MGGKCYVFRYVKTNWEGAKHMCYDQGLVMARFEYPSDIQTVFGQVEARIKGISNEVEFGVWVGANDRYEEDRVVWEDNLDKVESNLFDRLLPTGYNSDINDCAVMDRFYLLVMEDCNKQHYVFCMEDVVTWLDEKHLCHCLNSLCNDYNECERYRCSSNWFDEACQYRDLMEDTRKYSFYLFDNDDETCIINTPSPQTFTFEHSHFFTWLKISFHEPSQVYGINITFLSSGTPKECLGRRDRDYDYSKYIYCFLGDAFVDSMTLTWDDPKYICSIFIFGGKNVALKAKTNQTGSLPHEGDHTEANRPPSYAIADGEEGIFSECARVSSDGIQRIELTLDTLFIVYEILIFRRRGLSNYTFMSGFRLLCYNERNTKVFEYIDQEKARDAVVRINIGNTRPVNRILIELDLRSDVNKSKYLEICEMQVFGDCAPPSYGTFCENECNLFCKNQVCMPNGDCLYCALENVTADCSPIDDRRTPPAPTRKVLTTTTKKYRIPQPNEIGEWRKLLFVLLMLAFMLCVTCMAAVLMAWLYLAKKPEREPIQEVAEESEDDEDTGSTGSETSLKTKLVTKSSLHEGDHTEANRPPSYAIADVKEGIFSECARVSSDGIQRIELTLDTLFIVYAGFLYSGDGGNTKVFEYIDQEKARDAVVRINIGNTRPVNRILIELDLRSSDKGNKVKIPGDLRNAGIWSACVSNDSCTHVVLRPTKTVPLPPPMERSVRTSAIRSARTRSACLNGDRLYCAPENVTADCSPSKYR